MNDLVLMAFGILLPLGPAFVLYKLLPSTAKVEGPFKGLNLQLSGAFGGYFMLTLMVFGFLASRPLPKPPATEEIWEVTGKIDCQQGGDPVDISQLRLSMMPPSHVTGGDGTFIVQVPAKRLPSGDAKLPILLIEHNGHETVSIDLNQEGFKFGQVEGKLRRDKVNRAISLGETISLKRTPPYQPTGAVPQPVVPTSMEVPQ